MFLPPLWCLLLLTGLKVDALSYDYTASIECLASPHKPQYGGGIIVNPELNDGLRSWSTFGAAKIEHRESGDNKYVVAHSRNQTYDSVSQELYLRKNRLYTFSAWIQVSEGSALVAAVFKTSTGFKHAGAVVAESKCWSMLKGGFTADTSGPAELHFESENTAVEMWVDSISLQPFTEEQWRSHQDQSIEKARKAEVRIQAVDQHGNPIPNATISITQRNAGFPFGVAINKNILSNTAYQNWFTSKRFTVTTFEDEMKWYSTETSQGHVDYSVMDRMLQFAKQHNLAVRGHNVLWDDPQFQLGWVSRLSQRGLFKAAAARIGSVMTRYKGRVIGWDVVNENLHYNFFESRLRPTASDVLYHLASKTDGGTTLFMNEFNTIEESGDGASSPANYLRKLRAIQQYPYNRGIRMGIGLEGHFSTPNLAYMRASLDTLSAANLPLWLTEVDVRSSPNQAQYLEQVLREGHSHPKVGGIVIWAAWKPGGCYRMCLTDNNFRNLPTGVVVDKLSQEWGVASSLLATTDVDGFLEVSLFHGDYDVKIHHPPGVNSTWAQSIKVSPSDAAAQSTFTVQVIA